MEINAYTNEAGYRAFCQNVTEAYGLDPQDHRDMPKKRKAVVSELSSEPGQCFWMAASECFLYGTRDSVHADHHCGCSHQLPQTRHFVKNRETRNIMQIGSECIHRFEEVWDQIHDGYTGNDFLVPTKKNIKEAHKKHCQECRQIRRHE